MQVKVAALMLCASLMLTGCDYFPTTVQTVDSRPMVMFKTTLDADVMKVYVDTKYVGTVSEFLKDEAALRLVPGTHVIRIEKPDHTSQIEKFYVGDGVIKTIVVQ